MKYIKEKTVIKIYDKDDFDIAHILECGQVFCFDKVDNEYVVYPQNHFAIIKNTHYGYDIITNDVDYFENWFDLKTDYRKIKNQLLKFDIMKKSIEFGHGIRILNQNLFEVLISFIISANNNIKRIKLILNNLRKNLGEKISEGFYSFPSYEKLALQDENFFKKMGAGYRASYLVKVLKQVNPAVLEKWKGLSSDTLHKNLISLCGVGAKVADCVALFGFHCDDVFPVDTWIEKMYNTYFESCKNRDLIRKNLVKKFGHLSGYAQQYLFYYQRSGE